MMEWLNVLSAGVGGGGGGVGYQQINGSISPSYSDQAYSPTKVFLQRISDVSLQMILTSILEEQ